MHLGFNFSNKFLERGGGMNPNFLLEVHLCDGGKTLFRVERHLNTGQSLFCSENSSESKGKQIIYHSCQLPWHPGGGFISNYIIFYIVYFFQIHFTRKALQDPESRSKHIIYHRPAVSFPTLWVFVALLVYNLMIHRYCWLLGAEGSGFFFRMCNLLYNVRTVYNCFYVQHRNAPFLHLLTKSHDSSLLWGVQFHTRILSQCNIFILRHIASQ